MEAILDSEIKKKVNTGQIVSGAEAVILSLLCEGVETVFGYPGGAIMPIYDELYKYQEKLKHVLVRHEQGAIHAAQGFARVSGKVGVCMATSGPGATNLITGIADAKIDSTPLVCITGQVASHLLGTDAFQETDVIGISMPITKWNYQVTDVAEIPMIIAKAFYIALSGRPGPVLIDITKDAQFAQSEFQYNKCENIRSYHPVPKINFEHLQQAAKLINKAAQPYMLIGQGIVISEAEKELQTFVEKTGIPVASTLLGLSAIPPDNELYVGYLGMHGNYGPNVLTNECDLLIAVGMRFDDRVTGNLDTYAKQAKVIHIEIDPSEIDKNVIADVAVNADAKEALSLLLDMVDANTYPEWLEKFNLCKLEETEKVINRHIFPTSGELKMGEVVNRISEITKGEAVVVTDVGQHQMATSRYYKFKKPKSNITSGGLGTMGFALPAAIGAKLAAPHREVIAIIGDGGFQMTLQELGTIFQYKVPVKIVILNNNFLGMVRQWQQLFFEKRYSCTEMVNPDFIKIVSGYDITSKKLIERDELDEAIEAMLKHDGSYFMEVIVEKEENVFPMVPSGACVTEIRLE